MYFLGSGHPPQYFPRSDQYPIHIIEIPGYVHPPQVRNGALNQVRNGPLNEPILPPQVRNGALNEPILPPQVRNGALNGPILPPQVRNGALNNPQKRGVWQDLGRGILHGFDAFSKSIMSSSLFDSPSEGDGSVNERK